MYNNDNNIFNSIENLYNMNGDSWREVLATMYNNFGSLENAFRELEEKIESYDFSVNTGTPVNTVKPTRIGQDLLDTTNKIWYKSVGLSASDWKQVSN